MSDYVEGGVKRTTNPSYSLINQTINLMKAQLELPGALPLERRKYPVIGFRAWNALKVIGELGEKPVVELKSTGVSYRWNPGVNVANCSGLSRCRVDGGKVPSVTHECGLYVLSSVAELQRHISFDTSPHPSQIAGAVIGWGRVIQHAQEGWRAEKAQIVALMDLKLGKRSLKLTEKAAKFYGVPIMERKGIEQYIKEFGESI